MWRLMIAPSLQILLYCACAAGVASSDSAPRSAVERHSLDENTLLQVWIDAEEVNGTHVGLVRQYREELARLQLHFDAADRVFRERASQPLTDDSSAASGVSALVLEVQALQGRLRHLLKVTGQDPVMQFAVSVPKPSGLHSTKRRRDSDTPWPSIVGQEPEGTVPIGVNKSGDPKDLTDPWPAVGETGASEEEPWSNSESSSSSSSGSSKYIKGGKKANPWLILVLLALCVIVLASAALIVSPFQVTEGAKAKAVAEGKSDTGMRSRFVQVLLPYWVPTSPNSCGLAFIMLFLCVVFTAASLCFWVCYFIMVIGRTVTPFLVRPDAASVGHGCLGSIPLRIVTIVGIVLTPIVFLLRWRDVKGRVKQWFYIGIVIFLIMMKNAEGVASTFLMRIFMDSMFFSDADIFWKTYWVQCGALVFNVIVMMLKAYFQAVVGLQWREYVTHFFLDLYMSRRSYYEIDTYSREGEKVDNPDQRIQEDASAVTVKLLEFVMELLTSFIGLVSFATILWNLKPLLTVVAICYSVVGSFVGLLIAWKLVVIQYITQRSEADFRYSLVHVRNNPEAIAFYGGEAREKKINLTRFEVVLAAIFRKVTWDTMASGYMNFYTTLATMLPSVLLFASYFKGELDFGSIGQAGSAFITTMASLSFVVANMQVIAELSTAANRLGALLVLLRRPDEPSGIEHVSTKEAQLQIKSLTCNIPGAERSIVNDLNASFGGSSSGTEPVRVLLVGSSGVGKSSLLRVVAGLWKAGKGEVLRPPNTECLFLPQKPYMPLGDLRMQLIYPDEHDTISDVEVQRSMPVTKQLTDSDLRSLLASVGLGDLPDRFPEGFEGICDWSRVLSVGEQQRLATVRIFIRQPKLTILDEATSALSPPDEAALYQRLMDAGLSYFSVGHRDTLIKYHSKVIELRGGGEWKMYTGKEFADLQAKKRI